MWLATINVLNQSRYPRRLKVNITFANNLQTAFADVHSMLSPVAGVLLSSAASYSYACAASRKDHHDYTLHRH